MASSTETRKDIFKLTPQGQLELPELTSKSPLNTIEFRANDGIYVNGVRLSSGGGAPVGNTTDADYTPVVQPQLTIVPSIPFGKATVTFSSLGYNFDHVGDTSIQITFTENPSKPFAGIVHIIPIVRQTRGRANGDFGTTISSASVLDAATRTYTLTISFGPAYGIGGLMADYVLEIDFIVM